MTLALPLCQLLWAMLLPAAGWNGGEADSVTLLHTHSREDLEAPPGFSKALSPEEAYYLDSDAVDSPNQDEVKSIPPWDFSWERTEASNAMENAVAEVHNHLRNNYLFDPDAIKVRANDLKPLVTPAPPIIVTLPDNSTETIDDWGTGNKIIAADYRIFPQLLKDIEYRRSIGASDLTPADVSNAFQAITGLSPKTLSETTLADLAKLSHGELSLNNATDSAIDLVRKTLGLGAFVPAEAQLAEAPPVEGPAAEPGASGDDSSDREDEQKEAGDEVIGEHDKGDASENEGHEESEGVEGGETAHNGGGSLASPDNGAVGSHAPEVTVDFTGDVASLRAASVDGFLAREHAAQREAEAEVKAEAEKVAVQRHARAALRYLPESVRGKKVLLPLEPIEPGQFGQYRISNDELRSQAPGVGYRFSEDYEDDDEATPVARYGTHVRGLLRDGWLLVRLTGS